MAFIQLKRAAILLCVSMALSVPAAPTVETVEVIPGPGLPSLESLGLTSADLFRISAAKSVSAREEFSLLNKRVSVTCQDAPGSTVSAANAAACVAFLGKLTGNCTITGSVTNFCEAGDAFINGTNTSGKGSTTTTCADVASSAQDVLNDCILATGQVQGFATSALNQFVLVTVGPN